MGLSVPLAARSLNRDRAEAPPIKRIDYFDIHISVHKLRLQDEVGNGGCPNVNKCQQGLVGGLSYVNNDFFKVQ